MTEITPAEAALDALAAQMHAKPRHRIDVTVAGGEADIVDEVLVVLADVPGLELYSRSGRLVHVTEDAGGPKIERVESARVRDLISRHVVFTKSSEKGGEREVATPSWVGDMILVRPSWPMLRQLRGISTSPFLRRDGSICAEDGYDQRSGILVTMGSGAARLRIPDAPTQADAQAAAEELLEPFAEFPFAEEIHRSVVLAFMLSVVTRPAYDGPTPLFLADAPVPGAGKGKLIEAASIIATGQKPSTAPWSKNEEERRKTITAKLAEGGPIVLFDNLTSTLGGPTIDALLTSTRWSDRVLGRSESITLENRSIWCATSNNCDIGGDTARRTLVARLQPDTDRPDKRVFEIEDILDHVTRNRPRLLEALMTIVKAFEVEYGEGIRSDRSSVLREQRKNGLDTFGSFEGWSVWIRGAVNFVGLPDPLKTAEQLRDRASTELGELRRLVSLLHEYQGQCASGGSWTAGDLRKKLVEDVEKGKKGGESQFADLVDAFSGLGANTKSDVPSSRSLGRILRKCADRIVTLDGQERGCVRMDGSRKNTIVWKVEVLMGGFEGLGGFTSTYAGEKREKSSESGEPQTPLNPQTHLDGDWEVF